MDRFLISMIFSILMMAALAAEENVSATTSTPSPLLRGSASPKLRAANSNVSLTATLDATDLPADFITSYNSNCYRGHGAVDIDSDPSWGQSTDQCANICRTDPSCTCFVISSQGGQCWRRAQCDINACDPGGGLYTTYVRSPDRCVPDGGVCGANNNQAKQCCEGSRCQQFVGGSPMKCVAAPTQPTPPPTPAVWEGPIQWETHSEFCVEVKDGESSNGARVQLGYCSDGNYKQKFSFDGPGGKIRWIGGGGEKCIDVAGGSAENGNLIHIWDCIEHEPDQAFNAPTSGSGKVHWATHSNKCLDVTNGGTYAGVPIHLWDCYVFPFVHSKLNQAFTVPR